MPPRPPALCIAPDRPTRPACYKTANTCCPFPSLPALPLPSAPSLCFAAGREAAGVGQSPTPTATKAASTPSPSPLVFRRQSLSGPLLRQAPWPLSPSPPLPLSPFPPQPRRLQGGVQVVRRPTCRRASAAPKVVLLASQPFRSFRNQLFQRCIAQVDMEKPEIVSVDAQ
ncbi:hypothetical protein CDD83_4022 [Cordyceps sp. RAO-2017]|nr:hypothetical protein CDD83_4022 [Cordyceps sp. RAO-2017]